MITTPPNEIYTFTAEPRYRRVYQGTTYTLTWTDDKGEHKATSTNFNRLRRFASGGFKQYDTMPPWKRVKVLY